MLKNYLQGWVITYLPNNPITGRYIATRQGVRICAGSYEAITEMIRRRKP